jgi:hypothetical protein
MIATPRFLTETPEISAGYAGYDDFGLETAG